jgi:ABC-type phosphate transport system substrate-binding protein
MKLGYFYQTTATAVVTTTILLSSVATVIADNHNSTISNKKCGSGKIYVVGASSVERLTSAWAEAYDCPHVNITAEGGGSSTGIARACGTSKGEDPADIAGMTRLPFNGESTTVDGWNHDCQRSTRNLLGVSYSTMIMLVIFFGIVSNIF